MSLIARLLLTVAVSALPLLQAKAKPNVIVILADDMALGDLSCLNGGINRTPNLDQLKQESVWFPNGYSSSPVCAPARAALLTGRAPHRTGVVTLNMEKYPKLTNLRKDETTIAEVFQANGYVTGLIGKWHSGLGEDYHPLSRGFDEFEGFIGHLYVPSFFDFKLDIQRETVALPNRYLTDELSERAIEFVRRHKGEPFFLHLAHYAPHRPIEAPEDRIKPYLDRGVSLETATVYAMIEIMDEGIGELLEELDQLELTENTIVMFASDNGADPLVEPRFNLDLRGSKYEVHEGGIRVPFMWRWPGKFPAGENTSLIDFTDVAPTLAELCDLEWTPALPLDGMSISDALIKGTELPGRPRVWQWNREKPRYSHNAALRDGDWKLVRPFVTKNHPKGDSDLPPLLFNLKTDPGEQVDLSESRPERVDSMNQQLENWLQELEKSRLRPLEEVAPSPQD